MISFGEKDFYYSNTVQRWCIGKNLPENILYVFVNNYDRLNLNFRTMFRGICEVYINTKTNIKDSYNFMITYPNFNQVKELDEQTMKNINESIRWLNGFLEKIYNELNKK